MYLTPQRYPTSPTVLASVLDDYGPGTCSGEWSVDDTRINRAYTNRLKVVMPSQYYGPLAVIAACGIRVGDSYRFPLYASGATETDTGSFVQRIRPERDSTDSKQWIVTIEYAPFDVISMLGNSDISQGIVNPTDRALEVYWGEPAKYERYKVEDEGQPALGFKNTAGDPLLDPPRVEETRPVLFVVRNEATYDDAYASTFKDTVNGDEFLGYPPNTVKCRDIKGERFFDADWGWYHRVTYQFEFRDDDDGNGFTMLVASLGYRQLKNGAGSPQTILDPVTGSPMTDACPLQKDGSYSPGKDPYFIPFTEFPSSTFADLNLPDDILYIASGNV